MVDRVLTMARRLLDRLRDMRRRLRDAIDGASVPPYEPIPVPVPVDRPVRTRSPR